MSMRTLYASNRPRTLSLPARNICYIAGSAGRAGTQWRPCVIVIDASVSLTVHLSPRTSSDQAMCTSPRVGWRLYATGSFRAPVVCAGLLLCPRRVAARNIPVHRLMSLRLHGGCCYNHLLCQLEPATTCFKMGSNAYHHSRIFRAN